MSMTIKPATRQGVKPLIDLYSESGCGKTYSALMLARGLVGPSGKIVMIDTESGRGSLYADVIPGGYNTLELTTPFSPARYIEAITAVEESGADVLIIDSMSHEWEGLGGVLDMAGDNEARSGKPGLHCWKEPKMQHARMMLKLLQTPLPVICCVRAKYKSRQKKDDKGKTVIVKDDYTTPIQADDFIFEATAHAEILPDHTIRLTKCSHPSLRECFPLDGKEPIAIKHGEAIARWCAGSSPQQPASQPAGGIDEDPKAAKASLWRLLASVRGSENNWTVANQWLWDECGMSPSLNVSTMTAEQIREVTVKARKKLEEVAA